MTRLLRRARLRWWLIAALWLVMAVLGVVGSLPWSAVMNSRSSSLSRDVMEARAASNSRSAP